MPKRDVFIYMCLVTLLVTSCTPQNAPTSLPVSSPTSLPPTAVPSHVALFRADPQRTGMYDMSAIRHQPEVKWKTNVSTTWLMPPLVADGILFTGSGDGVLYALNAENGEKMWSQGGFEAFESTGAAAEEVFVAAGYSKVVRALKKKTGEELWSYRTDYAIQGAPLIVADCVYVATDHMVYALDLNSGQLLWKVSTGTEDAYMGAPAYDHGVIYTTGGTLLLALEAATGKEIWRVRKDENFLGLAVANGHVYAGNWDQNLYAFDQSNGKEIWKFPARSGGIFWSAPAVDDATVYAGNIDRFLYALNAKTGELRWSFDTHGDAVSEALVSDGILYVSDSSHAFPRGARHLYALDAATGAQIWVFETIGTFLPAPELANDTIYLTSTGDVIALK